MAARKDDRPKKNVWLVPQVARLTAGAAENGVQTKGDGGGPGTALS